MIKDFMDFAIDAPANKDYVIEELISNDSGCGVIVGRTGFGKTNLLLNIGAWIAEGRDILGLATKNACALLIWSFKTSKSGKLSGQKQQTCHW